MFKISPILSYLPHETNASNTRIVASSQCNNRYLGLQGPMCDMSLVFLFPLHLLSFINKFTVACVINPQ